VIGGRRFSNRRIHRWLSGTSSLAKLLRLKERDRDDLMRQAYRQVEAEDFQAADRLFALLGQLWPESESTAQLGRGVCAQRLGDLAAAEQAYDDVLRIDPSNAYALANRAEVRLLTGRHAAAHDDLTAALAQLPNGESAQPLRLRIEKLQAQAQTKP
jgi:Flp pilus assembly protein TadD